MKYLLDTHVLLWALYDTTKLPGDIKQLFKNPLNDFYVSVISPWEIEIKHQKKPDKISISGKQLSFLSQQAGYNILNINTSYIEELENMHLLYPNINHGDPFDRLLLACARKENMILLTHDNRFKEYNDPHILYF